MIEFRQLSDDHPDMVHSPLLRAARLTLQYAEDKGSIVLTQTHAFKRTFVKWAAENFDWPGKNSEELFRYNKVLNEDDFPPLETLHFLLIELKLGRHVKGEFRLTKTGKELAKRPAQLFATLIPFYVLNIDYSSYGRFAEQPVGSWDVWLNILNVEIDQGSTEQHLYSVFYQNGAAGETNDWRECAVFSSYVLRPLVWSGLVFEQGASRGGKAERHYFKTPLWRSSLKLDLDGGLEPFRRH